MPPVQIALIGDGGDGKSLRTHLRNAVFGEHHVVMTNDVFHAGIVGFEDEKIAES